MAEQGVEQKLAAILAADAVGYSALMWVARLGRREEAHAAMGKLLDLKPDFSGVWVTKYLHFAQQAYIDHIVADLHAAGLDGGREGP